MTDITAIEDKLSDIVLKVKKITEALYRITDFFPNEEPLKWALRKDAVEILDIFLSAKNHANYERGRMMRHASITIEKVLNLVELASFGSFIAKSNFEVLQREYGLVLTFIVESKFSEIDLLPNDELAPARPENLISSPFFNLNLNSAKNGLVLKNNGKASNVTDNLVKPVDEVRKNKDNSLRFNGRHAKILSLVKEKQDVSISDIHSYFNGISEKTIQRDLISLVNRGLLGMDGDKRWRRYSLTIASNP